MLAFAGAATDRQAEGAVLGIGQLLRGRDHLLQRLRYCDALLLETAPCWNTYEVIDRPRQSDSISPFVLVLGGLQARPINRFRRDRRAWIGVLHERVSRRPAALLELGRFLHVITDRDEVETRLPDRARSPSFWRCCCFESALRFDLIPVIFGEFLI